MEENILTKHKLEKIMLFSIEGNIGAGKSTLLSNISKDKITVVKEPIDLWTNCQGLNMLKIMYDKPKEKISMFQIFVMNTLLNNLIQAIKNNPETEIFIMERSIQTSFKVFAELNKEIGNIDDYDYIIIKNAYDTIFHSYPFLLKLQTIYIYCNVEECMNRIIKRKRIGENKISIEYLEKLETLHEKWLGNETKIINNTSNISNICSDIIKMIYKKN